MKLGKPHTIVPMVWIVHALVLVTCLGYVATVSYAEEADLWRIYTEAGTESLREGRYADAEKWLVAAQVEAEKSGGDHTVQRGDMPE